MQCATGVHRGSSFGASRTEPQNAPLLSQKFSQVHFFSTNFAVLGYLTEPQNFLCTPSFLCLDHLAEPQRSRRRDWLIQDVQRQVAGPNPNRNPNQKGGQVRHPVLGSILNTNTKREMKPNGIVPAC